MSLDTLGHSVHRLLMARSDSPLFKWVVLILVCGGFVDSQLQQKREARIAGSSERGWDPAGAICTQEPWLECSS